MVRSIKSIIWDVYSLTKLHFVSVPCKYARSTKYSRKTIVLELLNKNKDLCISHVFVMGDFNNVVSSQTPLTFMDSISNAHIMKTGWNEWNQRGIGYTHWLIILGREYFVRDMDNKQRHVAT